MLSDFFVFRTRATPVGEGPNGDATARCEDAGDFDVLRIHEGDQVLHDFVNTVFVEITVVTETK